VPFASDSIPTPSPLRCVRRCLRSALRNLFSVTFERDVRPEAHIVVSCTRSRHLSRLTRINRLGEYRHHWRVLYTRARNLSRGDPVAPQGWMPLTLNLISDLCYSIELSSALQS
jgi:hypothetical protein